MVISRLVVRRAAALRLVPVLGVVAGALWTAAALAQTPAANPSAPSRPAPSQPASRNRLRPRRRPLQRLRRQHLRRQHLPRQRLPPAATAPAVSPAATGSVSPLELPRDLSPWGMFINADIVVKAVMIGLVVRIAGHLDGVARQILRSCGARSARRARHSACSTRRARLAKRNQRLGRGDDAGRAAGARRRARGAAVAASRSAKA